jgi:phage terminase large subunit-like protein
MNTAHAEEPFSETIEKQINMNAFIHALNWKIDQVVDLTPDNLLEAMRNEAVAKSFEVEFANPSREAAMLWFNEQGEQVLPTEEVIASNATFVPNTYALDYLLEAPKDRRSPLEMSYYHVCAKHAQGFSMNFYRDQLQMNGSAILTQEALMELTMMPKKEHTTEQDRCGVQTLMLLSELNKFYSKKLTAIAKAHDALHFQSADPDYVETINHQTGKKLTVKEVEANKAKANTKRKKNAEPQQASSQIVLTSIESAEAYPKHIEDQLTKETLFSLMRLNLYSSVDLTRTADDIFKTGARGAFKLNMAKSAGAFAWFWFDKKGVMKSHSQRQIGDYHIPNTYAFDIILKNSYGADYVASERHGTKKTPYFLCTANADKIAEQIYKKNVVQSASAEKQYKSYMEWWNKKTDETPVNKRQDCYAPFSALLSDYASYTIEQKQRLEEMISSDEPQVLRSIEIQQEIKTKRQLAISASKGEFSIGSAKSIDTNSAKLASKDSVEEGSEFANTMYWVSNKENRASYETFAQFLAWLDTDYEIENKPNHLVVSNTFKGLDYIWRFTKPTDGGDGKLQLNHLNQNGKEISQGDIYQTIMLYSLSK